MKEKRTDLTSRKETNAILSFTFTAGTGNILPSYLEHDYVLDDSYFNFLFANYPATEDASTPRVLQSCDPP